MNDPLVFKNQTIASLTVCIPTSTTREIRVQPQIISVNKEMRLEKTIGYFFYEEPKYIHTLYCNSCIYAYMYIYFFLYCHGRLFCFI
jgi:hypothetical protein